MTERLSDEVRAEAREHCPGDIRSLHRQGLSEWADRIAALEAERDELWGLLREALGWLDEQLDLGNRIDAALSDAEGGE